MNLLGQQIADKEMKKNDQEFILKKSIEIKENEKIGVSFKEFDEKLNPNSNIDQQQDIPKITDD